MNAWRGAMVIAACALMGLAPRAEAAHVPDAAPGPVSVARRGAEEALEGSWVRTGPQGVTLRVARQGVEREETVPWSDVRAVSGVDARELEPWLAAGESLWRGRARVRRGDWALAIAPLERAAAAWRGQAATPDGAAAALALAQALAACGRSGEALPVAFEALRCLRAGVMVPPWAEGGVALVDVSRALPAVAAPLAVPPGDAARAATALRAFDARGDAALAETAALMASLLDGVASEDARGSARAGQAGRAASQASGAARLTDRERQGVAFLDALVQATAPAAEARAAARRSLGAMRRNLPGWCDAWIRASLGESLLMENDRAARERGVVLLLSVEAAERASMPALAAAAGDRAVRALHALGDPAGAERLRQALPATSETPSP